jgi:hypothetical protein
VSGQAGLFQGQPLRLRRVTVGGEVLLLSFINPACARFSCPVIGPEFRQATELLGGHQVELAGVVLSPPTALCALCRRSTSGKA